MMMSRLVKNVFRFQEPDRAFSERALPNKHINKATCNTRICIHIHGWKTQSVCDTSHTIEQGGYRGPGNWLAYSRQLPAGKSFWHHFASFTHTQKGIYIQPHTP